MQIGARPAGRMSKFSGMVMSRKNHRSKKISQRCQKTPSPKTLKVRGEFFRAFRAIGWDATATRRCSQWGNEDFVMQAVADRTRIESEAMAIGSGVNGSSDRFELRQKDAKESA